MSEEEYIDDEYVDDNNDPHSVEEVTEPNSISIQDGEEIIAFDEVVETIKTEITNFVNHDHMMEEKVLDSLRRGKLR